MEENLCEECLQPKHPMNTCVYSLKIKEKALRQKAVQDQKKLKYYLAHINSLTTFTETQDDYKHLVHERTCCDGCNLLPLRGTHYKCKKCPDFAFCFKCRVSKPHEHPDFIRITTAKFHYGKTCCL